jgi:hypothetical protein
VEAELEFGGDPEVAAAAAQSPEEVGVLGLTRLEEVALGGDHVGGDEVVDREPLLSMEPADPAAEREAGHAGVADEAAGGRETELLGLAVELAPENAGLDARRARLRVDADSFHWPQVDDDAAVADRVARIAMASASNGDREAGAPRKSHRRHHVRHVAAARDQRRAAIDRAVPHPAVPVIARVIGHDEVPLERGAQLAQGRPIDPCVSSGRAHRDSVRDLAYAGVRPQHCRSVNVVPQRPGS